MNISTSPITQNLASMTYEAYIQLASDLLAQGKSTNDDNGEDILEYTRLNLHRMKRVFKTYRPSEEMLATLSKLNKPYRWVVLTEGWCGDAAHIVPIFARIADSSPELNLEVILRDKHPEVMDAFLTNGARSIPKLIAVDKTSGEVVGSWGPRPHSAQEIVMEHKRNPHGTFNELKEAMQLWYNKNRGRETEEELVAFIEQNMIADK